MKGKIVSTKQTVIKKTPDPHNKTPTTMHLSVNLSDARLLLAVLVLVSVLALTLGLTVCLSKPEAPKSGQYYSQDFDRGSFLELGLIALMIVPFIIVYVFWS